MEWKDLTDVLEQHRVRNRANKPPREQQLIDAAQRHLQGTGTRSDTEDDNGNEIDNDNDEDDGESVRKKLEGNPKVLKYYSGGGAWVTAINKAKEAFRRFTIVYNLFPLRDSHLQDATRILSEAIADLKEEDPNLVFDRSKCFKFNLFARRHFIFVRRVCSRSRYEHCCKSYYIVSISCYIHNH